jgi:prophage antirepressor-like protein
MYRARECVHECGMRSLREQRDDRYGRYGTMRPHRAPICDIYVCGIPHTTQKMNDETGPVIERHDPDGYFRYGTHEITMFEMPGLGMMVATSLTTACGVGCIATATLVKRVCIPNDKLLSVADIMNRFRESGHTLPPRIARYTTCAKSLRFIPIQFVAPILRYVHDTTNNIAKSHAAAHMHRQFLEHFRNELSELQALEEPLQTSLAPLAPLASLASLASLAPHPPPVAPAIVKPIVEEMEFGFDISRDTLTFRHAPTNPIPFMLVDGKYWFRGNSLAKAMGYVNPIDAMARHIDEVHKKPRKSLDKGQGFTTLPLSCHDDKVQRETRCIALSCHDDNTTWIEEGGLYSLIMGSKLPQARSFKNWVCGEVLPAIRRTGSYNLTTSHTHPSTSTRVAVVPSDTQTPSTNIVPFASTAPAPSTAPEGSFVSPRMNGRFVSDFFGKSVFYLIRFELRGHPYMKFGITKDFENRFKSHYALLRNYSFALFFAVEFEERSSLERAFREHMRSIDRLRTVTISDNTLTEVVDLKNWTEDVIIVVVEKMIEQLKMETEAVDDIVDSDSSYSTFVADRHFELGRLKIEKEFELEKFQIENDTEKFRIGQEKEKQVELAREVMKNWNSLDGADVNAFLKLLLGSSG